MNEIQQKEILRLLKENGYMSVSDIAEKTYSSVSTVKRRLNALQENNLVIRTHGGAKLNESNTFLTSFSYRRNLNSSKKTEIAVKANKLIKDGDVIFLDGSTSCFYMIPYLREFNNITVITNGVDTLSALSELHIRAYSTGGKISSINNAVLSGSVAEKTINDMHADICFFSAMALNKCGVVSDNSEEEASLRKTFLSNANKKVFLVDDTKLDLDCTFKVCDLNFLDYVVCNKDLSQYFTVDTNINLL